MCADNAIFGFSSVRIVIQDGHDGASSRYGHIEIRDCVKRSSEQIKYQHENSR